MEPRKLSLVHMLKYLKFICSEKATKFCEISNVDLSYVFSKVQIYGGNFAKFCGLLRIYELYQNCSWPTVRKNWSSDREKHLKFEDGGQEFGKILRSLFRTNCANRERSE